MAIHDQRQLHHTNVSKQITLLAGIGVAQMPGKCFSSGIEEH